MALLTIGQKAELCREAKSGTSLPAKLSAWAQNAFKLPRPLPESTVRSILSRADQLLAMPDSYMDINNIRCKSVLLFDAQLIELMEVFEDDDSLSAEIVMELATYLADELDNPAHAWPNFSNGWLQKFQRRNGFSFRKRHGEAASVDMEAARSGREKLRKPITQYSLFDVYNIDETSFYYRQQDTDSISRRDSAGRKQDKTRLTLAVADNADGSDKLPLLVIGKAAQPCELKGHGVGESLDIDYTNSGQGWMTTEIYCDWLMNVDDQMRASIRHILLLVDNVSSHDESGATLTNVRVEPLPPNTIAVLQSMDQDVIASLKKRYMKKKRAASLHGFLERRKGIASSIVSVKKVDMLSAFEWVSEDWCELVPDAIKNCWRHAGLI